MSDRPQGNRRKKRRPQPQVRGEAVVRKVLAAVLVEAARAGYHGLRIEDVATRAGVNKTTVYRRWPTKLELVRDALHSVATELTSIPDTGSLRSDLLAVARHNIALAAEPANHALFRIFVSEGDNPELAAIVGSLREAFEVVPREVIAAAERRGELGPGVDPALLFEVLGAALNWWLLFERAALSEAHVARMIDLLLHGALASSQTPAE